MFNVKFNNYFILKKIICYLKNCLFKIIGILLGCWMKDFYKIIMTLNVCESKKCVCMWKE